MQPSSPFTHTEILAALADVQQEVAAFFGTLTADEFVLRVGDAWTPAQHLQHLNSTVSAVARGFATSRWLLRFRFGRARAPSRSYAEFRELYRDRLGTGARAAGPFAPEREDLTGAQIELRRSEILARWGRVNGRLRTAVADWNDRSLERIRLPHPLLGRITAREMLFFTIYHDQHHIAAAQRRLPRFTPVV